MNRMYAYQAPGVYFEWQDIAARAPGIQRTDIAGFIGIADRGPLHRPVKIESWTQYVSAFGAQMPQSYLAYGVEGFFANGGRRCWVVRVADPNEARFASLDLYDDDDELTLALTAKWAGRWAHRLIVTVLRTGLERFSLMIRLADGGQEIWSDLSMNPDDPRYALTVLNDASGGSAWVTLEDWAANPVFPYNPPNASSETLQQGSGRLSGGADGLSTLTKAHLSGWDAPPNQRWGLACLEDIDEIAMVAIPDIMPRLHIEPAYHEVPFDCRQIDPANEPPLYEEEALEFPPNFDEEDILELQRHLVSHCEILKDRFALLDMPPTAIEPDQAIAWRRQFDTSFAALYHPWITVADPLVLSGIVRRIPPSVHVAGIYARGDLAKGVHTPPANQVLEGVMAINAVIDDRVYGYLNEQGIDVIRPYSGRGIRVSGARTLSSDTELRYINVRRLLMMIIEVIDERSQDLVFEPHNPELWRRIERVGGAFLDQIWRAGMLDGATAADAYYLRCDTETNPPEEQDQGRVMALIGVNPPWPAEFVVVRIGFTESGATLLEGGV